MATRYLLEKQKEGKKRRKRKTKKKEVTRKTREKGYPEINDDTWRQEMLNELGTPGARARSKKML